MDNQDRPIDKTTETLRKELETLRLPESPASNTVPGT